MPIYEQESAAYDAQIAKLDATKGGLVARMAADIAKSDLESTIGAKVFDKAKRLNDLQTTMKSRVTQDLEQQINQTTDKLAVNEFAKQHLQRTNGEHVGIKDYTGAAGVLFGSMTRHATTYLSGLASRHQDALHIAAAGGMMAAPLAAVLGAGTYSTLSIDAVEKGALAGLDLALDGLGVDKYSRGDISKGLYEVGKLGASGGVVKHGPRAWGAGTNFVRANEFRNPLTFKFSPGRLNSGFPFDLIEFRNPVVRRNAGLVDPTVKPHVSWTDKDILSKRACNFPVSLTTNEQEVVMQWMIERKILLDKWGAQDLSTINYKMSDKLSRVYTQLRDHMTPDDLAAILKEARGVSIMKNNGVAYDHFAEWAQAQKSLQNALEGPWSNRHGELKLLKERLSDMSKLWSRYEKLMEQSKLQSKLMI